MLAKSWNSAFMDSRIMLTKPSYYALARGDTYPLCCTYGPVMEPKRSENCAFSYLQVAIIIIIIIRGIRVGIA